MPKKSKSQTAKNPPAPCSDVLAKAQVNIPDIPAEAQREGITRSNAYAANRIGRISQKEIAAKTLKIHQIGRQRGYKLDTLIHDPEALQAALDDFDLTCFDLDLYPLQQLVAGWLGTTSMTLYALTSSRDISVAGNILAMHADYCVSVISSVAMSSDKPPVFSIYYLKSSHRLYDVPQISTNTISFGGFDSLNISITADSISKNTEIFTEIENGKPNSIPLPSDYSIINDK